MFVQRQFQKYQKRSADEQQVSLLLKDFDDADQLLGRMIDASKAWREAWTSILTVQHRFLCEYDTLYAPIVGASDDYTGHVPVETPQHLVARTSRLKTEYDELKKDLLEELNDVQTKMIGPAQEAKDNLHIAKKVIKKREDKKLDYERYQSRVDASMKKSRLSDRDRGQLTKAQSDLTVATEAYNASDEHLRNYLPALLTAVWSLQPHLLAAQIQIQNNLLAHYYTMLHAYCTEEGFPSPSPPMDEVIRVWETAFKPAQKDFEASPLVASGKALRKSLSKEDSHPHTNGNRRPSHPSRGPSVSPARPPIPPSPQIDIRPKLSTSPSVASLLSPTPTESAITSPSPSASAYQTPSYAPAGPNVDYFSKERQPSTGSYGQSLTPGATTPGGSAVNAFAGLATKKKPPPPPPRIPSHHYQFVTALYDFGGQGQGDLAFKEGDKIKVLKKTDSTDDWWQGELRGIKGMFPANYVQV
ncbi:hypothetical protein H2198_006210 [Neophaeococcomyces mojaviensis]|uniref:Uncharacterized protein n=1 Tax=Neophaeococcomyces mojaviensis TaxID=3383035 RepID=A0ACC3A3E0_9EURO|nr:hypothetical protein H2198_006210 [Knufia sp. JES_112]